MGLYDRAIMQYIKQVWMINRIKNAGENSDKYEKSNPPAMLGRIE